MGMTNHTYMTIHAFMGAHSRGPILLSGRKRRRIRGQHSIGGALLTLALYEGIVLTREILFFSLKIIFLFKILSQSHCNQLQRLWILRFAYILLYR